LLAGFSSVDPGFDTGEAADFTPESIESGHQSLLSELLHVFRQDSLIAFQDEPNHEVDVG
jgi:hypothetical protein